MKLTEIISQYEASIPRPTEVHSIGRERSRSGYIVLAEATLSRGDFHTHEVFVVDGRMYIQHGHYDLTFADAMKDFQDRINR